MSRISGCVVPKSLISCSGSLHILLLTRRCPLPFLMNLALTFCVCCFCHMIISAESTKSSKRGYSGWRSSRDRPWSLPQCGRPPTSRAIDFSLTHFLGLQKDVHARSDGAVAPRLRGPRPKSIVDVRVITKSSVVVVPSPESPYRIEATGLVLTVARLPTRGGFLESTTIGAPLEHH